MGYNAPGSSYGVLAGRPAGTDGPLVVVFERDDSIAVPLLSHLRMAGYDVRGARTPVELFDWLQKHPVALLLIDLGSAATGRREFWVALDAQRRGRTAQVLTFRFLTDTNTGELDYDLSARALADVEVRGPQELQAIIDAALVRVPINGGAGPLAGAPLGGAGASPVTPFGTMFPGMGTGDNTPPPLGNGFGMPGPASGYAFGSAGSFLGDPGASFAFPAPLGHLSPSGAGSYPAGDGSMGGYDPAADPFGQQPSAFAGPASANPFAPGAAAPSQFDEPFNNNPFAGQETALSAGGPPPGIVPAGPLGVPGTSPFGGPAPQNPFAAGAADPMAVAGMLPFSASPPSGPASLPGQNGHAGWSGLVGQNGHAPLFAGGMSLVSDATTPARSGDSRAITDAWVPPGGDDATSLATAGPHAVPAPPAGSSWGAPEPFRPLTDDTEVAFPAYDTAAAHPKRGTPPPHAPLDETAPVAANFPALTGSLNSAERALGTVLVEGALLSPHKLEVLKGIQQMLTSVEMDFKLGELALLFKFLSPDQLLAALLVSRGLVTPQQIAGLGRIKQELGGSGMDYDLETLLVMFHVLPAEELRTVRKELM